MDACSLVFVCIVGMCTVRAFVIDSTYNYRLTIIPVYQRYFTATIPSAVNSIISPSLQSILLPCSVSTFSIPSFLLLSFLLFCSYSNSFLLCFLHDFFFIATVCLPVFLLHSPVFVYWSSYCVVCVYVSMYKSLSLSHSLHR